MTSWQDRANAPKPLSVSEQRVKAREALKAAREGLSKYQEIMKGAQVILADWEKAVKIAEQELELVDPRVRGLKPGTKLPKPGTNQHTLVLACDKPRRAIDIAAMTSLSLPQIGVLLTHAVQADLMIRLDRGIYLSRHAVLVALGAADNITADEDYLDIEEGR